MNSRNNEVTQLLTSIAQLLAVKGETPFRIRAYTEAAQHINTMSEHVVDLYQAGRLKDIPGVGSSIAAKIAEYLGTGHSTYYEQLKQQIPSEAVELLEVPGIGPERAHLLYKQLGVTTVPELQQAAEAHKLRDLPGFGKTLEAKIALEAARVAQRTRRMLLGAALPVAEEVARLLRDHPAVEAVDPAGSLRRMNATIGDIDILVATSRAEAVVEGFTRLPIVQEVLAKGPTRPSILTRAHVQVDLRVIVPDEYGSALQYFTGSKAHNIALRSLVMARGWKLSEYGLFDQHGQRIVGRAEQEIYQALDMDWMPPELRENRGEIEAALQHRLPDLVEEGNVCGDLHVHTNWSDGYDSPERMVEAAIARGYQYLAISDHSPTLRVAHGLSADRVREQLRLIDRLNERYAPFRVLHGTEVDILPDGELDYPDSVLAEFDIVTASVHSAFGLSREQMTARILRALRHPYVNILGHPTGRLLLQRPGYEVDLELVLQEAAEHGVALEIDGEPDRLDLDDIWSRRAKEMGALLVCDSDAHSAQQLAYMRYAIAAARRGWIEPANVLNTLPLEALLAYLRRLKGRSRQPIG
jgi:DNA polymerase (family X)